MGTPRSGFRRAAATSWALTGVAIASVAGASALAYADTAKPPPSEAPTDVIEQAPAGVAPDPAAELPPPPIATTPAPPPSPTAPPPVVTPETTADQAPARTYTPEPTYVPQTTVEQAPVTHQSPAPTATRTTQRRALTPTTVMAPNFSPRITRSRGS
ncbi:MAG TPA: hypothetical protein VL634_24200 [Mycobacterium sp.]|nr:hypothetical protein [Mycobacterium sp.]